MKIDLVKLLKFLSIALIITLIEVATEQFLNGFSVMPIFLGLYLFTFDSLKFLE